MEKKQTENGPSRRPAQGSKNKSFLNMQKDTNVEISSILQCQQIPKGMCIRLENYIFPNWEQQKTHLDQSKTSKN